MQRSTEYELNLGYPLFDGIGFRLLTFRVRFEVIGEVSVQIEAATVESEIGFRIDFSAL